MQTSTRILMALPNSVKSFWVAPPPCRVLTPRAAIIVLVAVCLRIEYCMILYDDDLSFKTQIYWFFSTIISWNTYKIFFSDCDLHSNNNDLTSTNRRIWYHNSHDFVSTVVAPDVQNLAQSNHSSPSRRQADPSWRLFYVTLLYMKARSSLHLDEDST